MTWKQTCVGRAVLWLGLTTALVIFAAVSMAALLAR